LIRCATFGHQFNVGINSSPCPTDPERTAEAYFMGTLKADDAAAFKEHCFVCLRCLTAAEDMELFVRRMRVAARRLQDQFNGRRIVRA
jgi:hypothetical protein